MTRNLHLEPQLLPVGLPPKFEEFYRASLRRVAGSRINATDLRNAYLGWACDRNAPGLEFHDIKRLMAFIGHSRKNSNGVQYLDLAFAADHPGLGDTLPDPFWGMVAAGEPMDAAVAREVISRIDGMLKEILNLRQIVSNAADRGNPVAAAQRTLGLFD
ncbi:hypothetical protein [Sphingomonas parapaucimobilis]|uniref:Uncharacterized protein n=1 Tax=Sphingomonas parapaucimobilis NBRC 15100 TaxID=1219049 RepID=A0A0A1W8L6_9SPHN|nr:hypothetical protein [Sphingomonas parapaucimobilis]GAM01254.1 hypothetical protein SP5_058_00030 [Sphingomonas parapaucimobilis NBRC 15100]